jgi:hypothetical protein
LRPASLSRRRLVGLALLAAGLCACESGFDRNDQIVNSLRILGVRAQVESADGMDWADADVGDTVDFSALVANPTNDPSLTVTWLACVPIPGQVSPCTYAPDLVDPTKLIPPSYDATPSGVILLGMGTEIQYTIPDEYVLDQALMKLIMTAQSHVNAECGLYLEIPLLVIAQTSTQTFTAQKNFRLSPWRELAMSPNSTDPTLQFYVRNINPPAQGLLIPTSLDACLGQDISAMCAVDYDCTMRGFTGGTCVNNLCTGTITFPPGPQAVCIPGNASGQTYYDCDLDGPITDAYGGPDHVEYPSVLWYMTAGTLSGFSGPNNGGTPSELARAFTGFTRPPGPFTLYGVVRDGRDGEAWVAQDFQ